MATENTSRLTQKPQRSQSGTFKGFLCVFREFCVPTSLVLAMCAWAVSALAQAPTAVTDYVVGPQDVLTITSYDQADLSGKFAVEADGTFTFPLIGRFTAGGSTLRQGEHRPKARVMGEGDFRNPQNTGPGQTDKNQNNFP